MKTHLNYSVNGQRKNVALCGNNNRQYGHGLKTMAPADFRNAPSDELCAHCCNLFLVRRNAERARKGLPPVDVWNKGFNAV